MALRFATVLLRAALLVAIVASAALLVDYQNPVSSSFCGASAGCGEVRKWATESGFQWIPAIGLGVFVGLFALGVWASQKKHARWVALNCAGAAVGAVALIAFQLFAIKAICMWCMAADVAALVAAAAAYWVAQHEPPSEPRGRRMLWAGVGVVAVTLPLVWAEAPERVALPAGLEALQVEGRINVVEFTDFECPYCRKLHPKLAELEKRHEGKLVLTRLMRPLKGHPGAEPAARAYLCASTEKQDAIAAALYEAPPAQLTTSGTVAIAGQVGLDTVAFARCLGSRETAAELERHNQMFIDSGLDAVPSTFVEDQLVRGFDEPRLSAAVRRAAAGGGQPGVEWMLALLGVLVVGVGWTSLKEPPRADEADEDDTADEDPGDDGATEDAAESGSDAV